MLAKAPPLPPIALLGKPMLLESPPPKPVTNPTALPSPPPKRAAKPAPPARQVYVIRRGESLADVAERYRVSLPNLRSVNGLNTNQLRVPVGTPITIPAGDS
jgi:LysM repeat protein